MKYTTNEQYIASHFVNIGDENEKYCWIGYSQLSMPSKQTFYIETDTIIH